ncbi:MAG TPA: hypothetical protein VI299_29625 [Polyangiales bacterium]
MMASHSKFRGTTFAALIFASACGTGDSKGSAVDHRDPTSDEGDVEGKDIDAAVDPTPEVRTRDGAITVDAKVSLADASTDTVTPTALPLLSDTHGGHLWSTFCKEQPDAAELPTDPRTLVVPGVNEGKSVLFNAYWVDCHVGASAEDAAPGTCGEYRKRVGRAKASMEGGRMVFFGGDQTDALMIFTADMYNNLWSKWGFKARPKDFDQVAAERWGTPIGSARNPYPLPGEDPNKTDGGSGQLPVALTQLRAEDGKYTGRIGMNCHWCHSGQVGEESDGPGLGAVLGSGNSLVEIGAIFGDYFPNFPIAANKVRGTGDILLYPAIAALDLDRAGRYNGSLIAAPSQGTVDYPAWWNMGHRTRRFHDGSFAMDDARPVMGFFMPIMTASHLLDIFYGREWIEKHDQDVNLWAEAMTAPVYPGPVDKKLAEEGAVLFHTKNLWKVLKTPAPLGGNGSCASCHGVYSPRFAHDPNFLARPELEGIAAYIAPLDVIGTDEARASSLNDGLKDTLSYSWWGYGTPDDKGKCFGVPEQHGYLAPPLYGIWASAPYFHNASVPTVWDVLKPSARPEIWRRVSRPLPSGWPKGATGFDTDLGRAYDHEKLGWKYDVLPCGEGALDCGPAELEMSLAGNLWFTWNVEGAPMSWEEIDQRKIYNTHKYSQGNAGHTFGNALSDAERKAIVEYLKTL